MTQPEPDTTSDLLGLLDTTDAFAMFEEHAWKPNANWDAEPMTRERFAGNLHDLKVANAHELRAVMLMKFAQQIANRIGSTSLTVSIGDKTSYTYDAAGGSALSLDYRASLVGDSANQELNAFIGLLVRGIGEHQLNEPDSAVRAFMTAIEGDFKKFNTPELGDYAEQQAKIALTDRAISAAITQEWPGFGKYALDGLYQLQASASQTFFAEAQAQLKSGLDAAGKPLGRQDRKRIELEMASQYLQASTTAPGHTFIDSGAYPWSMDIEQAGIMYRSVTNLGSDHEYAVQGNDIYAKVVERILDLPDAPPEPDAGGGAPDLSALMDYHEDAAGAAESATSAKTSKSTLENASTLGSDEKVKFDAEKFNQLVDQEVELGDERTPWAEGNPVVSYFTVKAKAGPVARARYDAIKRSYGPQIRKLRGMIEDQYTVKTVTERGLRSGRPDPARLVNVRFGRTEVFKRDVQDITGSPIDVVFIIDESGSMSARTAAKGYKPVGKFVDTSVAKPFGELAGIGADTNRAAEEAGGSRSDVARATAVMLHEAVRGLTGIRAWSLGYTTANRTQYGLPSKGGWDGDCIVRHLGSPKEPYACALTLAESGNADKEALAEAVKLLKREGKGARQAIIYLADGGISDPILEQMLRNIQREIPIMLVDMSNSVRGTGGSLKIDHVATVNSIDEAVKALGNFFKDIVLAA